MKLSLLIFLAICHFIHKIQAIPCEAPEAKPNGNWKVLVISFEGDITSSFRDVATNITTDFRRANAMAAYKRRRGNHTTTPRRLPGARRRTSSALPQMKHKPPDDVQLSWEPIDEEVDGIRVYYQPGDKLRLVCDVGYRINNESLSVITCTHDGNWTYEEDLECSSLNYLLPPRRVATECGTLPFIPHAIWGSGSNFRVGSWRTFTCEYPNYALVGASGVLCRETGLWEVAGICVPQSTIKCGTLPRIIKGVISLGGSAIGDIRQVMCMPGHTLCGPPFIACLKDGWSTPPKCLPTMSRFFKVKGNFTRGMAWDECAIRGGKLASIKSLNDQINAALLATDAKRVWGLNGYWTSGYYNDAIQAFQWSDRTEVAAGPTNWAPGQPDFKSPDGMLANESCLRISYNGQWDDADCFNENLSRLEGGICEYENPPPTCPEIKY